MPVRDELWEFISTPLMRTFHWGPMLSMSIIISMTAAMMTTKLNLLLTHSFMLSMCIVLYNMWCATFIGPGVLSKEMEEQTKREEGVIQKSTTRFCRRCQKYILARHHHCPWINTCVGQNNETYFLRFLRAILLTTFQSTIYLSMDVYYKNTFILFSVFNIGLSLGVLIATSVLLYTH